MVLHALHHLPAPDQPPGKALVHGNTGYTVLAEVISAVAGAPLPDIARQALFGPLGRTSSRLSTTTEQAVPRRARPPRTLGDGGL